MSEPGHLLEDTVVEVEHWLSDAGRLLLRPLTILRGYRREYLRADLLAGLTVAIVMLPQAIAYALIAGLPPTTGLYAAIVGSIVGALWGSSRHLHTGPTNATSLLALGALLSIGLVPGSPEFVVAAALLAVLAGTIRLALGLFHMGFLANFVSHAVVVGFMGGAGMLIAANQLKHLLRVDVASTPSFLATLSATVAELGNTHLPSLLLGGSTIAAIVLLKHFRPRWPAALLAMIGASIAVALLRLDAQGVIVLGALPRQLPPLQLPPLLDGALIGRLSIGAVAVAAIGLVEALSISRVISSHSGQHVENNQEFVGQGLANIAAGFFSGYPISGSPTRSLVNFGAEAQTQLAAAFSGLWVLLAMFLLAPLAEYLPRTALAGLLLVTAYGMVDPVEVRRIWRVSRGDRLIMVATFLATLFLPLEFAVLTGIMVSFARYIAKTSAPSVESVVPDQAFAHFQYDPQGPVCPQLGVVTINGSLYFGATAHVEEAIRQNMEDHPGQHFLLLRMHRVNLCDVSGLTMLESVIRMYRQERGDVFLTGVRKEVWRVMKQGGFDQVLGDDHFLAQDRAIEHLFFNTLDPVYCIYRCDVRIWRECQRLPKAQVSAEVPLGVLLPSEAVIPTLAVGELLAQLRAPDAPRLIDVREPAEYGAGHIPEAELLPMPGLLAGDVVLPQDRPLVFICRSGRRSAQVVYALQQRGYAAVYNVKGGMIAWSEAGHPEVIN